MNHINVLTRPGSKSKYGVTEKKKAELDALSNQVLNAQGEVEQLQAIVNSLTEKSTKLQQQLATADSNKATALSNKDLVDEVIDNAKDLMDNSKITFDEIVLSDAKIKTVAKDIKDVIDKLIYSAEVVNKLSNLVIRKKALNPLISDELITMITTAGTDANNAVALTLVALEAVFASQATTLESEAALSLEYLQAVKLYEFITGTEADDIKDELPEKSIKELLYDAYAISSNIYEKALTASKDTIKQLSEAKTKLSKAEIRLSSLESGLAAANAAALAS